MIPLVDLRAQHREVAAEIAAGFDRVLERARFVLGEEVATFERDYARFANVQHCVAVASGSDALELALRAAGVGAGDEVIVPTNSFVASAAAVVRAGATPVPVDVDPLHHLLDPALAAARLTARTKAIMPVHLYGQLAPMDEIGALAAAAGVAVIEDAAQAHGARQHGRAAGTFGLAAGTSFYPGKNLGAYGDAGAVLTESAAIADRIRALRDHGRHGPHDHRELGFNSRLDSLQAVVLNAKLARLAAWNEARRAAARRYDRLLADLSEVALPATRGGNEHVWHLYVVRVPRRDAVAARLRAAGIEVGIHYPVPIHLQKAFHTLGHARGDFPVAEAAAERVLSLPLFPEITAEQQARVAAELGRALRA